MNAGSDKGRRGFRREIRMKGYDEFRCIAGDCPFTCCQQWKIAVDEKTERRWEQMALSASLTKKEGEPVIRLTDAGFCPFLTQERLCQLVLSLGDAAIPAACREFPRQIHEFLWGTEYALVSCCPEVLQKLRQEGPLFLAGELPQEGACGEWILRNWMIEQIYDTRYTIEKNLKMIFYVMREIESQSNNRCFDTGSLLKEYRAALPELSRAIDSASGKTPEEGPDHMSRDTLTEGRELFLDIAQNYRQQGLYREYLEPLAQTAEAFSGTDEEGLDKKLVLFYKEFAGFDSFLRNYLACEFFANGLLPDSGFRDLLVFFQWIAMEYALVRQAAFLDWYGRGGGVIPWERLRDRTAVLSRMTGYNREDIYEYLGNCFDPIVWEWGYLALLVG